MRNIIIKLIGCNIVRYQKTRLDISKYDIRETTPTRAELYVGDESVAFIEYGGNVPKALKISRLCTTGQHNKGYAKSLLYYVLAKYPYLEKVYVKACSEGKEGDLTQERLVKFYEDFTYGRGSKCKIHIS